MTELLVALERAEAEGDEAKLASLANQLYEHFPDNQRVRMAYAEQCFRNGKVDEAENIASGILKEQPLYLRASSLLARIYFVRRENEMALGLVEMAEGFGAGCAEIGVIAGELHMRMGDPEKATEAFARARRYDPLNREAILGQVKAGIASAKPQADVMATLAASPEPASHEDLGLMLSATASEMSRVGKAEEAIRLYEGALRFIGDAQRHNKVRFNLALACFKTERFEECLGHANMILGSDPEFTKAADLIGVVIEKLKAKSQS